LRGVEWAPDGSGVYYAMEDRGESNGYFLALAPGSAAAARRVRQIYKTREL